MSSNLLKKGYDPHAVEKRWYKFWEKENLFSAQQKSSKPAYAIVIPPPNVTGVLHMGHALNNTMQDILCRYRRLKGDNVLWMVGTDHAGIATQNVVEKKLASEGLSRHELGREKFIQEVWKWRETSGSAIINQLKRLGASCDWQRERFTMDEGLSKAVRKVFVQLYNEDLIYRGNYIINWCCRCQTALSDLEVEHEEIDGKLYHFHYPYADGSGHVTIATTRPETMLGDTAVAVNPEDKRYQNLSCKTLILPLMDREIPIVGDPHADMSFGTGALKVTPAHDPHDFEIGTRHNLPNIKVIGDDGKMTAEAGPFVGLDRFECRKKVVEAMESQKLVQKIVPHSHAVGHCYRCNTVVEPNLSKQWFVKTKPLAQKAIAAVESGRTKIIPDMWNKTYFEWMYNIKDWCISRQIWWGHQIPAWTCTQCEKLVVDLAAPTHCPNCDAENLIQETDVLDTWFSSALWPFSTMGWPEQTDLLKTFYPTSVLVTAFDILFFWVARMMMMGIHFMGEVPFKDVYVHALVRDEEGKKMSKSKGNVIDPLNIIAKYGTDAFRFTLAAFAAQGRDIKMSEKRVEGYQHFINKLWNAARFALMHLDQGYDPITKVPQSLPDRWILSRLNQVTSVVEEALDTYKFNEAAGAIYQFVWHEFCDWYLETIKPAIYDQKGDKEKQEAKKVLWHVLKETLVILHPFTPFVTEEIWQKLPGTTGSIMKAEFPARDINPAKETTNSEAVAQMTLIIDIITAIRNVRGEMNIPPSKMLDAFIQAPDDATKIICDQQMEIITNLARLNSLEIQKQLSRPKASATAIVGNITVYISLEGIIDVSKETARLKKEITKLSKEMGGIFKKLSNEDFLNKAPKQIISKVRSQHEEFLKKQQKLTATLDRIKSIET
jgi:valyl-tRNA synthetase